MKRIILPLLMVSALLPLSCGGSKEQAERPAPSPGETWESVAPRLENLSFDHFLNASYRELTVRTPELVTELGLDGVFGLPGNRLNNLSEEYLGETERIQREILRLLQSYLPEELSEAQQDAREVMEWHLEDLVSAQEFRHQSFPVSHLVVSEPAATELFFTDVQPVETLEQAENYLLRLEQVGMKMGQLADGILIRQIMGIRLPSLSLRWTLGNLADTAQVKPERTLYFRTFEEKLSFLKLDEETEGLLLSRALEACTHSVIPGYRRLEEVLTGQMVPAEGNRGSWILPDGESFYRYALSHHTTTDFTPEEIHRRGHEELERIHRRMRLLFEKIGIDAAQPVARMYRELDSRAERIPADKMVDVYTGLIEEAKSRSAPYFTRFPKAEVLVKGVDAGGFYLPAAVDGSRPGVFFATNTQAGPYYKMPTLTFHETVPGHHFQITLANEADISPSKRGPIFWAIPKGGPSTPNGLWPKRGTTPKIPPGISGGSRPRRSGRPGWCSIRGSIISSGISRRRWIFSWRTPASAKDTAAGRSCGILSGRGRRRPT